MAVAAYVALGSNVGDREAHLDAAVRALRGQPGIVVGEVSPYYVTEPVGGPPGQPPYLNAVAAVQTDQPPRELLGALLDVEQRLGRVRRERHGPRTIDMDLLLYGDRVVSEPDLAVPHPRLHERRFVLAPLAEIAPDVVHPELRATASQLLARLPGGPAVWPFDPTRLDGLRAVVTGSTSGIGRAVAAELAGAGARVVIHGRHAPSEHGAAAALRADLADPAQCRRLVEEAWGLWGDIDVWVNNAGADTLTGDAGRWPFERKLDALLAVDVTATMLLARDVGGRMKAAGGGVIINVGWDQADTGMEGDSGQLFGATKAAVMAFTKGLAVTLAPEVRVNCVAPGWIRTAWGEGASARWQERVRRETPLERWGTPKDVARAVRWLAAPAAAFITGQVIRVNGGAVR